MKKSVKVVYEQGNFIKTREMGQIAKDISKIFADIFGVKEARGLCDDLGCILCDNYDLTDDEWSKQRIEED